jgi:hypothetical protein
MSDKRDLCPEVLYEKSRLTEDHGIYGRRND